MRFHGIPSEETVLSMAEKLPEGEWIFEDLKEGKRETLSRDAARRRLAEMVREVTGWKKSFATVARGTVFIFVHNPEEPKAFKVYDPSSLGCSTALTPPRWKLYLRDLGEI